MKPTLGKEKIEQLLSSPSHRLHLSSSHPSISASALQKAPRLCEFNASKSTNVIRFTDSRESKNPEVCARPAHLFRQEFQNATDVVWQTFLKAPIEASKKKTRKEKSAAHVCICAAGICLTAWLQSVQSSPLTGLLWSLRLHKKNRTQSERRGLVSQGWVEVGQVTVANCVLCSYEIVPASR